MLPVLEVKGPILMAPSTLFGTPPYQFQGSFVVSHLPSPPSRHQAPAMFGCQKGEVTKGEKNKEGGWGEEVKRGRGWGERTTIIQKYNINQ